MGMVSRQRRKKVCVLYQGLIAAVRTLLLPLPHIQWYLLEELLVRRETKGSTQLFVHCNFDPHPSKTCGDSLLCSGRNALVRRRVTCVSPVLSMHLPQPQQKGLYIIYSSFSTGTNVRV